MQNFTSVMIQLQNRKIINNQAVQRLRKCKPSGCLLQKNKSEEKNYEKI